MEPMEQMEHYTALVLDVMLVLMLMNGADWAQTNDSTGPNVSPVSILAN